MSSTWIRKIHAYTKRMQVSYCVCDFYIMMVESAESNVINDRGGHPYRESIFMVGDWSEQMKDICKTSYAFESGDFLWKPGNKTAEGFIRTAKKALKEAQNVDTFIPCEMRFSGWAREETIELFANYPNVRVVKEYGVKSLYSKDFEAIVLITNFFKNDLPLLEKYNGGTFDIRKIESIINEKKIFNDNNKVINYLIEESKK